MRFTSRLLAAAFCCALAVPAFAQQITGAGSTFVYPILSKWSEAYSKITGAQINYQSIGSGGGIAQIKAATVDFGASDAPLPPDQLSQLGLAQFPVVIGGILPVVNLEGIEPGQMRFTGPLLADIYLGKIKKWNDPAIAAVNPGVKLPDQAVTVVHRSDGSGTTYNWVDYLSKVSPEWKAKVGIGTSVSWPTGVGGKGNEGVAEYVNRIKGAIGYVEYAYVLQNKMKYGQVKNEAGKFIKPSIASFQAAAASAEWSKVQDFDLVMTDAPGADAYPVTATTFILMYKQPKDAARSHAALAFFKWAFDKGADLATSLDYVPLPPPLVQQIETYWQAQIH
ncbi:MAG TPA: phosphate ABC transporter substrate-binding protein PstS [Acetobacteraceae bacterium]|nr:phosphate ABC transporter substrate-binding protein PstS [Acetobacteraceae bacterium]